MMQRIAIASLLVVASCEASLVKMGLQKDKMPVAVESVLHTFERARRLEFFELRHLQTAEDDEQEQKPFVEFENAFAEIQTTEEIQSPPTNETPPAEFVEIQQGLDAHTIIDLGHNQTVVLDMNQTGEVEVESDFFEEAVTVAEDLTGVGSTQVEAVVGRSSVVTGPRGGTADMAPKIDPTEISFMIVRRDDFAFNRVNFIYTQNDPFVHDWFYAHFLIVVFLVRHRPWKTFGCRAVFPTIRLPLAPNSVSQDRFSPRPKNSESPADLVPLQVPSKRIIRIATFT